MYSLWVLVPQIPGLTESLVNRRIDLPVPTPDPVNEANASGGGYLGWPDFATIMGALAVVGGLILAIMKQLKGGSDDDSKKSSGVDEIKEKLKELRALAESLEEDYDDLKKEVADLKQKADKSEIVDETTAKDIDKLEKKIDRLIDMMLKMLSEG